MVALSLALSRLLPQYPLPHSSLPSPLVQRPSLSSSLCIPLTHAGGGCGCGCGCGAWGREERASAQEGLSAALKEKCLLEQEKCLLERQILVRPRPFVLRVCKCVCLCLRVVVCVSLCEGVCVCVCEWVLCLQWVLCLPICPSASSVNLSICLCVCVRV